MPSRKIMDTRMQRRRKRREVPGSDLPPGLTACYAEEWLAGVLLSGEVPASEVLSAAPADEWFDPAYRAIAEACDDLEGCADVVRAAEALASAGGLGAVGGISRLLELVTELPTVIGWRHWAALVVSAAERRERFEDGVAAAQEALSST